MHGKVARRIEAQAGPTLNPAPAIGYDRRMAEERSEGSRGMDPYQAKYMGGEALYHDKIRAPLGFHLLLLFPLLVCLGATLLAHAPLLVPILTAAFVAVLWALFSVLRISVTREEVYVQYGLFGPRIPVRDIEQCDAVDYDWKQYGGWGIRYGRDGSVAYNMMGDGGRAVKIVHRSGGESRTVLVASPDPVRLATAINQARAASAAPVRARIEAPPAAEDAAPAEAAEDEAADAEGGGAEEKRRA